VQLDPETLAETIATAMKTATAPLRARIELLEKWAALPPRDGKDGQDGAPGKDADPSAIIELKAEVAALAFDLQSKLTEAEHVKSVTPDDLRVVYDSAKAELAETFQEMLAKAIAALPKPKDGVDGQPGRDGRDGMPGIPGTKGMDGAPGANGQDGAPGRDGSLEHLKADYDGERTITLCHKDGAPIDGGVIRLPIPLDRGVWRPEGEYVKGDTATFGGSLFIAQKDEPGKPEAGDGWRLAVKRGRDGRNGKDSGPTQPVKIR
jgi:hypothetical protein